VSYLYQSGYYSYLIKVGLGLSEDACVVFALFNLCLLGLPECKRNSFTKPVNFFDQTQRNSGTNFIFIINKLTNKEFYKKVQK
jgi:hypothetical protein